MANYNYDLAMKTIQKYSDLLESATMGMQEDWFWTAECVYENGSFKYELDKQPELAGIKGSRWATPTLQLCFKDGTEKFLDCYDGDVNITNRPEWLELGCLSGPCQEIVDIKVGKFIN